MSRGKRDKSGAFLGFLCFLRRDIRPSLFSGKPRYFGTPLWRHGLESALPADPSTLAANLRHNLREKSRVSYDSKAHRLVFFDGFLNDSKGVLNWVLEFFATALWHTFNMAQAAAKKQIVNFSNGPTTEILIRRVTSGECNITHVAQALGLPRRDSSRRSE
jgi:hypothetical protein